MLNTALKPYFIRACYEWCADQGFTPYLAVAVNAECQVPQAFVKGGEIVLNIAMEATGGLELGNDAITFQARFGGVAQSLYVPIHRVKGVFPSHAPELGLWLEVSDHAEPSASAKAPAASEPQASTKPKFTLVK